MRLLRQCQFNRVSVNVALAIVVWGCSCGSLATSGPTGDTQQSPSDARITPTGAQTPGYAQTGCAPVTTAVLLLETRWTGDRHAFDIGRRVAESMTQRLRFELDQDPCAKRVANEPSLADEKLILSCGDEDTMQCIVAIAYRVEADRIIYGNVVPLGTRFLVELKAMQLPNLLRSWSGEVSEQVSDTNPAAHKAYSVLR
jgi:hypothetical protein